MCVARGERGGGGDTAKEWPSKDAVRVVQH
jgi:hypothetical protein